MRKKTWQATAHLNKLFLLFYLLFFSIVAAFSQTITGTVTDVDKKPISKVTIELQGSTRKALSDNAGKFSITASKNDVLVFSCVGYVTKEVRLNGQQSVNVL